MSVEPGRFGISTRTVKAVDVQAVPGDPIAPSITPAVTFHLGGDGLDFYGRASNPAWRQLESALAGLEGAASALVFGSGMAAITAVLRALTVPGSTLVVPADGYYQVRAYASEYLAPQGINVIAARRALRRRKSTGPSSHSLPRSCHTARRRAGAGGSSGLRLFGGPCDW